MQLVKALRDGLAVAAAMLALVAVAMVTFALGIWGALAAVVP